jgi:hypothetical protein
MMLALAAAAEAFVENLEEFRSIVELMIRVHLDDIDWEELFDIRETIVKRVLAFAPPVRPGALDGDHITWIQALDNFIERSAGRCPDSESLLLDELRIDPDAAAREDTEPLDELDDGLSFVNSDF